MLPATSSQLDSPRAWLIVVAGFIASFVGYGVAYSFGVFLKPMSADLGVSHATMSALFSVSLVLSFVLGPLTGDLADHLGPRPVVVAGALLMASGLLITAHTHDVGIAFLAYGAGIGGGIACVFVTAMAAIGEWFKARREIALGVAISGIGVGTLVSAPLAAALIARYGWRQTYQIFSFASLVLLLICAALMHRAPVKITAKGGNTVAGKLRTRGFALLYACIALSGSAVFISMVSLPDYAAKHGATQVAAAALVGYIGAASVVGRLGLDAFSPRFGLITMYQVSYVFLCASYVLWLTAHSYAALVAFALVMGIGYGGLAAMTPAVAVYLFGIEDLGELLGILFTGYGVASLFGPPVAGVLLDRHDDYTGVVLLALVCAALGLLVVLPLRMCRPVAPE